MTPTSRWKPAAAGAVLALACWFAFDAVRDQLPAWLRFLVAGGILTFGPGAAPAFRLLAPLSVLSRTVLSLAFGLAFAPMLAHVLGAAGVLWLYPYLCALLTGAVLGFWGWEATPGALQSPKVLVLVLVLVTLGMGVLAFGNRIATERGAVAIHGEYDSYDLTYYAEIAAELSHTVPPASPFFSGRMLNHSFYPHVVLAMVHRFGGVPLLDLYFRFGWPAFLTLAVLVCFVFVESVASASVAFVSALLFAVGSNLAYLAAWFLHPAVWDEVIWSHNFQGAGAEVLLYGNWTPALAAMFAGFYAVHASLKSGRGWALVAGAVFASTILSKPWIFASVLSAMAAVMLASRQDRHVVRRLLLAGAASLVVAAPFLYRAVTLVDDAQVTFEPAFFPIPLVMADRIGLRDWLMTTAAALGLSGAAQEGAAAVLALPIFLLGTIGARLIGLPTLWRCLRRPSQHDPIWRLLAWTVVAAFLASSFIVSVPYHESQQIHQFALFLLALFAAKALAAWHGRWRIAVAVAVFAAAVPGTAQYLHRKWTDREHVVARASGAEIGVASFLRATDPERTVLLHDRPNDPTLLGLLSERRSVLSWAAYVRGSEERRADVDAFFGAPETTAALEVLRKYRPTHVVEYEGRDRIDPRVRGQLEFVFRHGEVTLYRVPETLR